MLHFKYAKRAVLGVDIKPKAFGRCCDGNLGPGCQEFESAGVTSVHLERSSYTRLVLTPG